MIVSLYWPAFSWLSDWFIFAECTASSISAIFRNGLVKRTFNCHWKGMKSWFRAKRLVFCSCYNASTLFLNLQQRRKDRGILQTRYPLLSTVRLSVTWQSRIERASPILHPGTHVVVMWVLAMGTITSTQLWVGTYMLM